MPPYPGYEHNAVNSRGEPMDKNHLKAMIVEPFPQTARIEFGGETIAETKRGLLMLEKGVFPTIYFPLDDVSQKFLTKTDHSSVCPYKGDARYWTIKADGREAANAVWTYAEPLSERPEIKGYAAFDFNAVDGTFVNGNMVRGHVRDPHKIIAVDPLGKRLTATMAGKTIIDSTNVMVLHETGLQDRLYVPDSDIAMEFMVPSPRQSVCTYKGDAIYHNLKIGDELSENTAWCYPDVWTDFSAEVAKIKGHHAFYLTRFDSVEIDGEPLTFDDKASAADKRMLDRPTVDKTLKDRQAGRA
jgi:uncharacterized protein (DUF427 family)